MIHGAMIRVAAVVTVLACTAEVQAGVILVSQNRYTREWSEQRRIGDNGLISSSDTKIAASGFLPFIDSDGRAQQNSTIDVTGFSAIGSAFGNAGFGTSTYFWTSGDSVYHVLFDVTDEPIEFSLTSTNDIFFPADWRRLSGPGGQFFDIPSGTLDGTLAVGRWTLLMRALADGGSLGMGSVSRSYSLNMSFVPEPAAISVGAAVALPRLLRRRRPPA